MSEHNSNNNTEVLSTDLSGREFSLVPTSKTERMKLLKLVKQYVAFNKYIPPLSIEELNQHTNDLMTESSIASEYKDFVMVLINNEVWKATLAAVPFERRVFMIPQCLRSTKHCKAEIDEYGLLCEQCGACPIGDFQSEAEELGYVVLVAEGTTIVTRLIESGKIDAVIGISCLSVLEKTFPYMASGAVPGIAIPLLTDGCKNTTIDKDWVFEAIRLKSDDISFLQVDIPALQDEIKHYFEYEYLLSLLGEPKEESEKIAISCLAKSGKRWRPFLLAAVFKALHGNNDKLDFSIQKLALAVECFHKASLIHDDIEDNDDVRYGEAALHKTQGVPIAINIGDLLLGEGYRMIAECGAESAKIAKMLLVAAEGHKTLCLGQGEDLYLEKSKKLPSTQKILDIFKWKTSPAFEVALQFGAIYAGADQNICKVFHEFSESLGIAYQIKDDLDDFAAAKENNDMTHLHSSLLLILASEVSYTGNCACELSSYEIMKQTPRQFFNFISEKHIENKAYQLCEHYKNRAIRVLSQLQNTQLKTLLRKMISKIFNNN